MSLAHLVRSTVLGFFIACNSSSEIAPQPVSSRCDNLSQAEMNQAFSYARREMETHGQEIRSGILNNPAQFTELAQLIRYYTDCEPSRRQGSRQCDTISYCGPGTDESCPLFYPGECLNEVCKEHDHHYEEILNEEGQLCLWSNQTNAADATFFRDYGRCNDNGECGFYCKLVGTIALNLAVIEQKYDNFGPGCLWDGSYAPSKDKEDEENKKKKEPKDSPDIDWNLRRLCDNFIERMKRCDVGYLPSSIKQLLAGDGCVSKNDILEKNREIFECDYETTCSEFEECVRR